MKKIRVVLVLISLLVNNFLLGSKHEYFDTLKLISGQDMEDALKGLRDSGWELYNDKERQEFVREYFLNYLEAEGLSQQAIYICEQYIDKAEKAGMPGVLYDTYLGIEDSMKMLRFLRAENRKNFLDYLLFVNISGDRLDSDGNVMKEERRVIRIQGKDVYDELTGQHIDTLPFEIELGIRDYSLNQSFMIRNNIFIRYTNYNKNHSMMDEMLKLRDNKIFIIDGKGARLETSKLYNDRRYSVTMNQNNILITDINSSEDLGVLFKEDLEYIKDLLIIHENRLAFFHTKDSVLYFRVIDLDSLEILYDSPIQDLTLLLNRDVYENIVCFCFNKGNHLQNIGAFDIKSDVKFYLLLEEDAEDILNLFLQDGKLSFYYLRDNKWRFKVIDLKTRKSFVSSYARSFRSPKDLKFDIHQDIIACIHANKNNPYEVEIFDMSSSEKTNYYLKEDIKAIKNIDISEDKIYLLHGEEKSLRFKELDIKTGEILMDLLIKDIDKVLEFIIYRNRLYVIFVKSDWEYSNIRVMDLETKQDLGILFKEEDNDMPISFGEDKEYMGVLYIPYKTRSDDNRTLIISKKGVEHKKGRIIFVKTGNYIVEDKRLLNPKLEMFSKEIDRIKENINNKGDVYYLPDRYINNFKDIYKYNKILRDIIVEKEYGNKELVHYILWYFTESEKLKILADMLGELDEDILKFILEASDFDISDDKIAKRLDKIVSTEDENKRLEKFRKYVVELAIYKGLFLKELLEETEELYEYIPNHLVEYIINPYFLPHIVYTDEFKLWTRFAELNIDLDVLREKLLKKLIFKEDVITSKRAVGLYITQNRPEIVNKIESLGTVFDLVENIKNCFNISIDIKDVIEVLLERDLGLRSELYKAQLSAA